MLKEVSAVVKAIPHHDLCIQWDLCIEMLMWDSGAWRGIKSPFADTQSEIIARIKRLCAAVPSDVELGIHLCYGDMRAKHSVDPVDAGKLVEISNAITRAVKRPIAYIHMPVPIDRNDEDYFRPLADLRLKSGTELYLGLVHAEDDRAEATKKRIAAASKYVSNFGIASECGMARACRPDLVMRMLKTHARASREPAARRA